MKLNFYYLYCFILLISYSLTGQSQEINFDPDVKISVITCTPGQEIYSTFGHTAFRVEGEIDNKRVDWIYNYGTFEFTDDFEMEFAQGKLNYTLSKEKYPNFQYSYLQDARGVTEQVLNLTLEQKKKLYEYLEWNYLEENREYLYDFFYNNCSTKTRDILLEICGDGLVFENLSNGHTTFRTRIDQYLKKFPWTDFGIDLVLGIPCDKIMGPGEEMFLPDYLYLNLQRAKLDGKNFVIKENELLLEQEVEINSSELKPKHLFWIIAFAVIALMYYYFKKQKKSDAVSITFYLVIGLIGCLIFLMWFATDHLTTKSNLNLLWAFPLCLIFPFIMKKDRLFKKALLLYSLLLVASLIVNLLSIQDLHPAVTPIVASLLACNIKNYALR